MNSEKVASLIRDAVSNGASFGATLYEYGEMLSPEMFQELFEQVPVSEVIKYLPDRVNEIPFDQFIDFFESNPLEAIEHRRGRSLLDDPSKRERLVEGILNSSILRDDWETLKKVMDFIPDDLVGTYGTSHVSSLSEKNPPADVLCVIMKEKPVSEGYISTQVQRTNPMFLSLYLDVDVIDKLRKNDLLYIAEQTRVLPNTFWKMDLVRQSYFAVKNPDVVFEILLAQIEKGGDVPGMLVDFLLDFLKGENALKLAKLRYNRRV